MKHLIFNGRVFQARNKVRAMRFVLVTAFNGFNLNSMMLYIATKYL